MLRSRLELAGLALSLLMIAAATLPSGAPSRVHVITLCLVCATNGLASAGLNVALFVPFGFFLQRRWRRTARVVRWGFLLSLAIELLQLTVVQGRETAVGDLVANTAGAALGALLAWRPGAWLLPRGDARRGLGAAAAALSTVVLLATAELLEPSAPPGHYWVQWNPEWRRTGGEGGEVIASDLDGAALVMGRMADPDPFRAAVLAGGVLRVRIIVREPAEDPEPLFRVVTGVLNEGTLAFSLLAHRDALVIEPRFRADDHDLARPPFRLEGALAGTRPGDTLDLRFQRVVGRGESVTVGDRPPALLSNTIGRGWALIYTAPNHLFALRAVVDLLWLGALAGLVGWYARSTRATAGALVPLLIAAWWAPRTTDLDATRWREYAALVAGAAAGALLRRAAERLAARLADDARAAQRREGVQTS